MKKFLVSVKVPSVSTSICVTARDEREAQVVADSVIANADPNLYEGLLDSFYDEYADVEEIMEEDSNWGAKMPNFKAAYGDDGSIIGYEEVIVDKP